MFFLKDGFYYHISQLHFFDIVGFVLLFQASMLEIYNETIRDLLSSNRSSNGIGVKQHSIKLDGNGNMYVTDLTIVDVCTIQEVSSLLRRAAQSRYLLSITSSDCF